MSDTGTDPEDAAANIRKHFKIDSLGGTSEKMSDMDVLRRAGTFRTWFQKAVSTMFIGIILSQLATVAYIHWSTETSRATILVNRENGYKTRAILCTAIYRNPNNRPIPSQCSDPKVERYYDSWIDIANPPTCQTNACPGTAASPPPTTLTTTILAEPPN